MIFSHNGSLGDVIFSTLFAKELSEAVGEDISRFHLQTNVKMDFIVKNHPYVDVNLTLKAAQFLKPLLEVGCGFKNVTIGDDVPKGALNLSDFRRQRISFSNGDIRQWYYSLVNLFLPMNLARPTVIVKPSPVLNDRIIICKTARYNNCFIDWKLLEAFEKHLVFVGLEKEHDAFEKEFFKVDFYRLSDGLEFAQLVAGSKGFIGNQSRIIFCRGNDENAKNSNSSRVRGVYREE